MLGNYLSNAYYHLSIYCFLCRNVLLKETKVIVIKLGKINSQKGFVNGSTGGEVMEALDIWVRAVRNDDFFCCFWRGY